MSVPAQAVSRDALRTKIFSQKAKVAIISLDDGVQIEVRQSSVGDMLDSVSAESARERMAKLIISSCYVPGTDDRIFEAGDLPELMAMPSGGYYRKIIDAVNDQSLGGSVEDAKKLSEPGTPAQQQASSS